jgi:UPF0755 protein
MEDTLLPKNVGNRASNIIKKYKKTIFYAIILIVFLFLFYFFLLSAPADFQSGVSVNIDSGMSLRDISALLKNKHIIRSRTAFEYSIIILGGEKHIVAADYLFENKMPVWQVVLHIIVNGHHTAPISITIPEGFDLNQISETAQPKLVNFNKVRFLTETKDLEGYLFPDTYFFLNNANDEDVIKSMNNNFEKKITPILPQIISQGKTEKEIIIMASIIEHEAKGDVDRGIISGILWKRIQIGMPLQVDSVPETYKTKGLPDSPIGNPGLKAIEAAINPQSSSYLYYLHDKDGNIHYAKTFAEHEINIEKYLK